MIIRSSDLRRLCASHSSREPCAVCKKHRTITEAHHIVPLREMAELANLFHLEFVPEPSTIWLCPNCHKYLHNFTKAPIFRDDVGDAEFTAICDLYIYSREIKRKYIQEIKP